MSSLPPRVGSCPGPASKIGDLLVIAEVTVAAGVRFNRAPYRLRRAREAVGAGVEPRAASELGRYGQALYDGDDRQLSGGRGRPRGRRIPRPLGS